MLVEPTPIRPSRRGGRLATILLLVGPVVVIVWPAVQARPDGTAPATSDSPGLVARPTAQPISSDSVPDTASIDSFPASAFGLPVRSVTQALEARVVGDVVNGLAAVGGFLSADLGAADCVGLPADAEETFCRRSAIVTGARASGEPHLDARIPPGTALVATLGPRAGGGTANVGSIPVVLIGRLGRPTGSCVAAAGWCNAEIVVERVAWASGQWLDGVVAADPSLAPESSTMPSRLGQVLASREADRGEIILTKSILGVDLLRAVDPAAAEAIGAEVAGPVWYVRSVASPRFGGGQRLVSWVVIDDATGLILAAGPPATG